MNRSLTSIAALASVALMATACSDPAAEAEGGGSAGGGAVEWPEPTADLDGVTLTLWAAQNSTTIPEQVTAAFEKATGAKVEIVTIPDPYEQSVQTRVATGDKPDLAFWQPTASMLTALNADTNLQPLDGAPWIEELQPELQDMTGLLDDTRYAALISSPSVEGVYYNKDVFAQHGITEPPGSFDEMVDLARKLDSAGVTPFYGMAGDRWATQWWVQVQLAGAAANGFWDDVNSGEKSFESPVVLDAITRYRDLVEEGLFNDDLATATFEEQGDALLAGEAAMALQVNSFFGQLQAKADTATLNEKIGFFPISPSGNVGTYIPDQSNALVAFRSGDEQKEAAARQLLAFWMGPGYEDFVAGQGTISLKPDVPTPDSVPQALLDAHASLGDSVGSMQALAAANPDLYLNLADMVAGEMTPKEVAAATQDQFEQLASAAGVEGF
ncbi:carbohydrate ABC transporter substrate-binding protein (CUT1 family) [Haloactinopolyspora alba]|uniref:Carbohydrate ABC transporter substrate-binding protein (CUT1 family) n=1 Tax=Haloactinopolyspora alba TaxID=648780 RepID=A0A2P8DKW3_9ACTN|nr:ABC transporter substrate-binding protein [Haloactinopolyspora alba]PSK97864.1 carbohydrate ABC transporter substrate-binding protein (CUT1 family) [Haloactinopolyspora alba]